MTYEEYLADNQRLRKRIIELEQENARHKRLDEPLLSESKSPTLESDRNNHLILEIRAKNVNFVRLSGIPN